jgi:phospholipase C
VCNQPGEVTVWKNFAHDQRTLGSKGSFLNDARPGRLPQVSWLVSSFAHQKDEHPPADVSVGMGLQQELITAVRESPLWERSAFLLTYDEHGGYFDHVEPPQLDAYGRACASRSGSSRLTQRRGL